MFDSRCQGREVYGSRPSARENFVDMGGDSIFRGISRPEEGEVSDN